MECIQCIAKDANKELFDREDLDHYEKTLFRATIKKQNSMADLGPGMKHSESQKTDFKNMSVSKSRLDQSLDRSVSFTEDKIGGGAGKILTDSLNLDESA